MDLIGTFLDERCVITDGNKAGASDLYAAYRTWCEDNSVHPSRRLTQRRFGETLTERGLERKRDGTTRRTEYQGVGIANEAER